MATRIKAAAAVVKEVEVTIEVETIEVVMVDTVVTVARAMGKGTLTDEVAAAAAEEATMTTDEIEVVIRITGSNKRDEEEMDEARIKVEDVVTREEATEAVDSVVAPVEAKSMISPFDLKWRPVILSYCIQTTSSSRPNIMGGSTCISFNGATSTKMMRKRRLRP